MSQRVLLENKPTTRSKTKNLERTSHRQSSEIHRAISSRDKKALRFLLENGEKPCMGEGINCFYLAKAFCPYEYVHILLEHEPKGVNVQNIHGVTLLMFYAQDANSIRDLVKFGANTCHQAHDGNTPLMFAMKKNKKPNTKVSGEKILEAIRTLLEAGANANATNLCGENVLTHASRNLDTFTVDIFQILIDAGVDPLTEDTNKLTFLSHAMNTFVEYFNDCVVKQMGKLSDTEKLRIFKCLNFIISLPQFENFNFSCNTEFHPQSIILSKLLNLSSLDFPIDIFSIFLTAKFLNPNLIVNMVLNVPNDSVAMTQYLKISQQHEVPVGPIGLMLNVQNTPGVERVFKAQIKTILKKLLCCGYTFTTEPLPSVSPLTVLLLNEATQNHCKDKESLVKFMVKYGAHVEQRMVPFQDKPNVKQISEQLFLPDSIRAAVSQGWIDIVTILLPHFAHPPLALLRFFDATHPLFHADDTTLMSSTLFSVLASWGPLYNTPLHESIKTYIFNMGLPNDELQHFITMHSSPPKLKELCRTAVRCLLAPRAAKPGNSLPRLILSISPPGLRDYLLMKT